VLDASRLMPEARGIVERAAAVYARYTRPFEQSVEEGIAVIRTGVAFLQIVKSWWQECGQEREGLPK
jgi:hypothetical protein